MAADTPRVCGRGASRPMEQPMRTRPLVFVTNGDPIFLLTLKQLLIDEGFDALTMPLIDHPFGEIKRTRPDLLIIDFPYHEELAWQLLDQLDADPTTQQIAIIATSTDPGNLSTFETRMSGRLAAAILLKPYDLDPLMALVSSLMPAPR
jgi:DNA-binding response OmpR family regulator